jgi:hypothetical protein
VTVEELRLLFDWSLPGRRLYGLSQADRSTSSPRSLSRLTSRSILAVRMSTGEYQKSKSTVSNQKSLRLSCSV